MRTTIPFAENRAFDPETAHHVAAAFQNAWKSLTARGDRFADPLKAAHSREVLAKRVIELAQRGERDSIRLCDDSPAGLLGFGISVPLPAPFWSGLAEEADQ